MRSQTYRCARAIAVRVWSSRIGHRCSHILLQGQGKWYTSPNWLPDTSDIPSGKLQFGMIDTSAFWEAVFTFLCVELFDSFGESRRARLAS